MTCWKLVLICIFSSVKRESLFCNLLRKSSRFVQLQIGKVVRGKYKVQLEEIQSYSLLSVQLTSCNNHFSLFPLLPSSCTVAQKWIFQCKYNMTRFAHKCEMWKIFSYVAMIWLYIYGWCLIITIYREGWGYWYGWLGKILTSQYLEFFRTTYMILTYKLNIATGKTSQAITFLYYQLLKFGLQKRLKFGGTFPLIKL